MRTCTQLLRNYPQPCMPAFLGSEADERSLRHYLGLHDDPGGVTIRLAIADDAIGIAHLHVDVWEDAYAGLMPAGVLEPRRSTITERIQRWRDQRTDSPAGTTVAEDTSGLVDSPV